MINYREAVENILNTNGNVLKVLDLASFSDNGKKGIYFIDNDKHYFILKRLSNDGPLFLLSPIKEKPEICNQQKWSYFKNLLNKHQNGRVKLFEILQSDSNIKIINRINSNSNAHSDNYGKLNILHSLLIYNFYQLIKVTMIMMTKTKLMILTMMKITNKS